MSVSLSNVDQTEFDAMVKKAYQSGGFLLRNTVRLRENVEGKTVSFRKVGSVQALQYSFQSQVLYQDPNYNKADATLLPYRAPTLVDDMEQWLYNFDEKMEDAELIAMALGRRHDQIIINALNASGTANTIAEGSTNLTYAKVREVNKFFNKLAVPREERYFAISADGEEKLLDEDKFTNSRYVDLNLVKTGSLDGNFAMGMNWIVIPEMAEGGLPLSGTIRSCFAWHKKSMGMAIGRQMRTIIERVPTLDSWQILGKTFAGAIAVDAVGIIKCDIDESA